MSSIQKHMQGFRPLTAFVEHQVGAAVTEASDTMARKRFTGTAVYAAVAKFAPAAPATGRGWVNQCATALVRGVAGVAQAAVWAPTGVVMGAVACLLGAAGRKAACQDVLLRYYMPIFATFSLLELSANFVGMCLFGAWVKSLFR